MAQSQSEKLEYLGLLKLQDSSLITYKLQFEEQDGLVKGYSFTDLNGDHETKSRIIGRFDSRSNRLEFRETEIIYTKSNIQKFDFCHIYFTGKLRNLSGRAKIDGDFKSFYDDLQSCLHGSLQMKPAEKIQQKTLKFQRKVDRMKRIPDSTKQKINMDKMFNRYNKTSLIGGETVNLIWPYDYLKIVLWDDGKEDGDQIKVLVNSKIFLQNQTVTNKKQEWVIPLKEAKNKISVMAVNSGSMPPNTAKIALVNVLGEVVDLSTYLKVNEVVDFEFFKEIPKN
jgi:hypothetical protein